MSINENRKISHKVGVKVFSDTQLENVLPTYESLFSKIEMCRNVAKIEMERSTRYYQDNFMYDNVFSVLGQRGTGKTSVAFTLQEKIKQKYEKKNGDVVLPLIIPEAIPDNCTILGWLLAIVKEEAGKLEREIKKYVDQKPGDMFDCICKYERKNLTDKLERMNQLFHAGSYNPSNEKSYYKAVDNSVVQAEDYYQFAKRIAELWDAWVNRIKDLYRLKTNRAANNICPLIYFIFDDVDMAPNRVEQLLSVIIKYLSHPNIIVIATAHEELFTEVIENQLDHNIGKLPKEWRKYLNYRVNERYPFWDEDKEEESDKGIVEQTARMYLSKVLPTSTRYYLRTFRTAKQKEKFWLEDEYSLGKGIHQKVLKLLQTIGNNNDDFMEYDSEFINFYLTYIGSTSREIGNAYIALCEFIDNMISVVKSNKEQPNEMLINKTYQYCRYFIRVAINANHEITEVIQKVDDFIDEILLMEYNQWKIYIHYAHLNEILNRRIKKTENGKQIEIGMQVYSLFVFVENILLVMENGIPGGIAKRKKVYATNFLVEYIEENAFEKKHLFHRNLQPNEFFGHYNNLFDRLHVISKSAMSDMKFNMEYFYNFRYYRFKSCEENAIEIETIFKEDPQWFRELSGMLSMVYGNVYLFGSDDMAACLPYTDSRYQPMFTRRIERDVRENISESFKTEEMHKEWMNQKENYTAFIDNIITEKQNLKDKSKDVFIDMIDQLITDIKADEEIDTTKIYSGLSVVLDKSLGKIKKGESLETIVGNWFFVSDDIIDDMQQLHELENINVTKELLLKYQQIIATSYTELVKNGLVEDKEIFISQLDRLRRLSPVRKKELSNIINRLRKDWKKEESPKDGLEGIISKGLYLDIFREINFMKMQISQKSFYFEDMEDAETIDSILYELSADIDIAIKMDDKIEIRKGIELASKVIFYELLQNIYIYQVINMRYESNNSLSSRELEMVQNERTYYYSIYQQIVEVINKGNKASNTIRDVINSIRMEERQSYINRLIAEVTNE